MDKHQKELVIAVVLVLIAIIMAIFAGGKIMRALPKRSASVPVDIEPMAALDVPLDSLASFEQLAPIGTKAGQNTVKEYNIEELAWGRDPFVFDKAMLFTTQTNQSHVAKLEQLSRLKLTGMIISDDKPQDSIAVINGENLKVGEKIMGFALKEIRANSVILEWDSEEFLLQLWEEETQKEDQQGQP